jgi:hypothetical protein
VSEEPKAQRTLVKSPPELWAEVSDPDALGRHLDGFGSIRITRLEPETTVVWEGERASGTVELEPSGWGTKVTLSVELAEIEAGLDVVDVPDVAPDVPAVPEPEAVVEVVEPPTAAVAQAGIEEAEPAKRGFFARMFGRRAVAPVAVAVAVAPPEPEATPEPEPVVVPPEPVAVVAEPEPEPEPALAAEDAQTALASALDSLGAAHHRPFSRG